LLPEKIRSFEIGINHRFTAKLSAAINYLDNNLTDIIFPTGEVIIPTYPPQLENSGKVNAPRN
jgi:outer membrane cobalamin receptor